MTEKVVSAGGGEINMVVQVPVEGEYSLFCTVFGLEILLLIRLECCMTVTS